MNSYNTNLAAEYHVLSVLYRLGKDAYLTLGNKKSVDIIIETPNRTITVDVKGMAGTTNWPLDNFAKKNDNHFIVLVSYLNKIDKPHISPEVYVVPSTEIEKYFYHNPNGSRQVVQIGRIRKDGNEYRDNWDLLT